MVSIEKNIAETTPSEKRTNEFGGEVYWLWPVN
jgi:hypothetical protein